MTTVMETQTEPFEGDALDPVKPHMTVLIAFTSCAVLFEICSFFALGWAV